MEACAPLYVMLSYEYWIQRVSRRPKQVVNNVHDERQDYTVIGVIPPVFLRNIPTRNDVYIWPTNALTLRSRLLLSTTGKPSRFRVFREGEPGIA